MNLNYKVDPEFNCKKYIKSHDDNIFSSHNYSESIIKGDFCNSLISILFNTNNLENTKKILKEFKKKTKYPEKIQFCIKIDSDMEDFVINFLNELSVFNFNFIVLVSPKGRGFIDLWQWVNFLFKVSSKRSKFIMNISDEMYVTNKNWDTKLEKYVNFYTDGIFRLRTSVFKNRNYNDLYECGYAPDTTAIYTRKYLEIQGNFSPCFGPDNGQQFVSFYLSKLNLPRHFQFLRDVVTEGIDFKGQGTNLGLNEKQRFLRNNLNFILWRNMFRYKFQNDYFQRARKIQLEILKIKYEFIDIEDFGYKFHINFNDNNKNKYLRMNNYLPWFQLFIYNLSKLDFIKNNTGFSASFLKGYLVNFYFFIFKRLPNPPEDISSQGFLQKLDNISKSIDLYAENLIKISVLKKLRYGFGSLVDFALFYMKIGFFILFFILYILQHPHRIGSVLKQIFNRLTKNCKLKVKSNIFSNDESEQSKTIIVKGD